MEHHEDINRVVDCHLRMILAIDSSQRVFFLQIPKEAKITLQPLLVPLQNLWVPKDL